jgi:tetratricopeptide (TPR) repeat protein
LAAYLNGQYDTAVKAIMDFRQTLQSDHAEKKLKKFEISELLLFEAKIHEDNSAYYKAVNILSKKEKQITNQTVRLEMLSRVYTKMGKQDKALEACNQILEINPNDKAVYM